MKVIKQLTKRTTKFKENFQKKKKRETLYIFIRHDIFSRKTFGENENKIKRRLILHSEIKLQMDMGMESIHHTTTY